MFFFKSDLIVTKRIKATLQYVVFLKSQVEINKNLIFQRETERTERSISEFFKKRENFVTITTNQARFLAITRYFYEKINLRFWENGIYFLVITKQFSCDGVKRQKHVSSGQGCPN